MVATTFEDMGLRQPPAQPPSRFSSRCGWKKRGRRRKDRAAAAVDPGGAAGRDHGGYAPPDGARMPASARRFHEANRHTFHLVSLADGCTLRVDAGYLPLKPNALDAGGGRHCRCQDDAQGLVAAYLLHWPAFAAAHFPRAWTLPGAQAFSGHLLEAWGLAARRLRRPGLERGTVAAAAAALEGGPAGVARRRREWEARRVGDAEELDRRRRAEDRERPAANKRQRASRPR